MIFYRVLAISLILTALLAFSFNVVNANEATGTASHEDQLEEEGNVEGEGAEQPPKASTGGAQETTGSAETGTASDTPASEQQDTKSAEELLRDVTDEALKKKFYKIVEEELAKLQVGPSEHVQLSHLFLYPAGAGQVGRSLDLPTGKTIRIALHMHNKGDSAFHVDLATAAFRYPMDMSYIIQNFTTAKYHGQDVEPGREASFLYQFYTDPQLAARSFGLTVQLGYRDAEGKSYMHSAINQTVTLYEPDEGFEAETFFMYIFLTALTLLAGAGVWYLLKTYTPAKKLATKSRHAIAKSTSSGGGSPASADGSSANGGGLSPSGSSANYNLEWIPQQHLDIKNRRAKQQQSPRQRKSPSKQLSSDASE